MTTTPMQYRSLGRCGTKVSAFGLGGWTTFGGSVKDDGLTRSILHAAFDAGVNFFDIADVYAKGEAEKAMGKALAELPRHRLVIATKLFWPMSEDVNDRGLSRKHIMESVEKSLARIGTDYIDIYFCHRADPETPLEETVRAMDDLVHQGKILYWGTSEWTGGQIHDACRLANERNLYRPQVEQPQLSLLVRRKFEQELRPQCDDHGIGFVVWSPLASGLLTGKYDAGMPKGSRLEQIDWLRKGLLVPDKIDRVKRMKPIAESLGCTRTQLALAWTAAQEDVSSVILGATTLEQLEENLGALDVKLDLDINAKLDEIFPPTLG
jgi:voltage-dependent potassium channel beta subunit